MQQLLDVANGAEQLLKVRVVVFQPRLNGIGLKTINSDGSPQKERSLARTTPHHYLLYQSNMATNVVAIMVLRWLPS